MNTEMTGNILESENKLYRLVQKVGDTIWVETYIVAKSEVDAVKSIPSGESGFAELQCLTPGISHFVCNGVILSDMVKLSVAKSPIVN